ncbi:MAG TPA: tetratricopeptide repeat protein [Candidatus Methylomirabilis sp.]|nr:tetratricopeptide repeat protein [Candidatus Methylomirabilis sp.]
MRSLKVMRIGPWLFAFGLFLILPAGGTGWVGAQAPGPAGIRILVVRTEIEVREAIASVRAGVRFERLVRERSIGPERDRGGYLGRVDPASLPPAARAALDKTKRGMLSPVFSTDEGFAIFQVLTLQEEEELEARAKSAPEAQDLFKRGTELGKVGDLDRAAPLLQQATALDPDLVDAHFNLAIVERRRGRMDAAIASMRRVIELRPEDFEAHMRLGSWLAAQGSHAEATRVFERAAALQMDSREAWLRLAQSYEAAGRLKAAVGAYRRVVGLLSQDDPALSAALFRVAMLAGDGPVAVEAARKLLASRPGHEGFIALGEALLLNGEADAAILEYQKAVALAPASPAAQVGLGSAYARLGRGEAAAERFLRAVELEPGNPAHYRRLARLYQGQGRLDLAIVALRDGLSAAATFPPTLQAELSEELSALYERAGMLREAERERLRANSLGSR